MALIRAGRPFEACEVTLRDKPAVMVLPDATVLDIRVAYRASA